MQLRLSGKRRSSLRTKGFPELNAALKSIGDEMTRNQIMQNALLAAAEPIRRAVASNAPVSEGRLRTRIVLDNWQPPASKNAWYLRIWVEESSDYRPRLRKAQNTEKKRAPLSYQIGSTPVVYGFFQEFGTAKMAPNPFMRPAWDSQGGQLAVRRVTVMLKRQLALAIGRGAR